VPADSLTIPAPASASIPDRPAVASRGFRLAVAALVALTLVLRLAYLLSLRDGGFVWADVDQYLAKGASLLRTGHFAWTWDAVAYPWGGRVYALPPLYSLYLAPFAAWPSYPFNAFVGLAVLNALAVPLVAGIGTRLHSERAGLVAAVLYAGWGSDIAAFGSVRQEPLYVPLVVLAFWLLARAWDDAGGRLGWGLAGAGLGLAALCRSMPIYFVAAMAVVLVLRDRRGAGPRHAAGLLAGFGLLALPYSLALSLHLGQPTLIENHGGILVAHRLLSHDGRVPGFTNVAATLVARATRTPLAFAAETADQARSLLHVAGGRFIQDGIVAESAAKARAWAALAHLLIDVPWILALGLAPLGLALARRKPLGAVLVLWALLNIGLTAITGFGGSRLRAPFEPHLVLLASVVLAGGWARPRLPGLGLAALASAALMVVLAPQIERSFAARANYGPRWRAEGVEHRVSVTGAGGSNILVASGALDVVVENTGPEPVQIDLTVDGTPVMAAATIPPGEHRAASVPYGPPALAFVEVSAVDAQARPATVNVRAVSR
jgi:4-amino-4-deoxy-L-arabinose transferase-like glycosyltransferase